MIFILTILSLIVSLYVYLTWNFDYWAKRGVISPKAKILLGDLPNGLLRKKHISCDFDKIYNDFKGKTPFVGIIQTRSPRLLILEPEIAKDVLIRKFNNFRNNEFADMIDFKINPFFGQNPVFLKDDEWKEKRAEKAPVFTPTRLKAIYPIVQDVLLRMIKYIRENSTDAIDVHELSSKYTIDVISNCIFGIDAHSFGTEKSMIREMRRRLIVLSKSNLLKVFLIQSFPFLKNFLKIQLTDPEAQIFFVDLMNQALKYREDSNVQREDFLDYVIQLQKKKNIDKITMTSHTISFFTDGFETSLLANSHALYELAKNKRVQDKLRDEINQNCDQNGLLNFDTLNELPYLDQVFHEALRMHSPNVMISRLCSETVDLEFNGQKVTVEEGINVIIPINSIHNDSNYFVEPKKFHPERFEDVALKSYRDRCIFNPFGNGARQCLGMKFALMQSKASLAAIIYNFEVTVNEKTQDNPLIIDPNKLLNDKIGGLWINFKEIKN